MHKGLRDVLREVAEYGKPEDTMVVLKWEMKQLLDIADAAESLYRIMIEEMKDDQPKQ